MRRFLAWYLRERLGNAVCFRPVYRWCGSRALDVACSGRGACRCWSDRAGATFSWWMVGDCPAATSIRRTRCSPARATWAARRVQLTGIQLLGAAPGCAVHDLFHRSRGGGGILRAVHPVVRPDDCILLTSYHSLLTAMK